MKKNVLVMLFLSGTVLTSCAVNDPDRRAKSGAAIGAITGAVLGHQIDDDRGRFLGAAIGAIAGATAGGYMDRQERELKEQLQQEQASNQVSLERVDAETLKLNLDSAVTFGIDSARLKSSFYRSLNKVANVLADYDKTAVHVIGHTDSTGSASYNQRLSENRARSVGNYLEAQDVNRQRIVLEGRGERSPTASNSSEFGRQQNRRVEIYLKTIVEGREHQAFKRI